MKPLKIIKIGGNIIDDTSRLLSFLKDFLFCSLLKIIWSHYYNKFLLCIKFWFSSSEVGCQGLVITLVHFSVSILHDPHQVDWVDPVLGCNIHDPHLEGYQGDLGDVLISQSFETSVAKDYRIL